MLLAIAVLALPTWRQTDWTVDWYRFSPAGEEDAQAVFRLEPDGALHVLDLPPSNQAHDFGYIATRRDLSNYHLSLRYRWGDKRFAPRANDKRDAGVLYHVTGP